MESKQKLSKYEYEFMDFIWNSKKEEICFQDFVAHFSDKDWKRPTLSVFLHRLFIKGYLSYYKRGRYSFYKPLVSRVEYGQAMIDITMCKLFGVPFKEVIGQYCGKEKLNKAEMEAITEFLERIKNS